MWLSLVSNWLLLICLKGSQEVCVRPAEPDPDFWRAPAREHHSHQHYGVAGTGMDLYWHSIITFISSPVGLISQPYPALFPSLSFVWTQRVFIVFFAMQYVAELLHEQAQPIVSTCSAADVQAAFNTIVTRIQRLWVHTHTSQSRPHLNACWIREFQNMVTRVPRVLCEPAVHERLPSSDVSFLFLDSSAHLPSPQDVHVSGRWCSFRLLCYFC